MWQFTLRTPNAKLSGSAADWVLEEHVLPTVLSIAGTGPTGGAGIQTYVKAFSALGAYGMTAASQRQEL